MKPTAHYISSRLSTMFVWMLCGLYLLFSVGVVKATHFCMGREASVSYFTAESKKCPCSLFAKEKDDCCDDQHDLLKLEDTQKNLQAFALSLPSLTLLGTIYDLQFSPGQATVSMSPVPEDAMPPPKVLFKIHCSYVFYDEMQIA